MTVQEIEAVVRFCLTHTEQFNWVGDDLAQPNPKGEYLVTIVPKHSQGLLEGSADHLEKRILWYVKAAKEQIK